MSFKHMLMRGLTLSAYASIMSSVAPTHVVDEAIKFDQTK